MFLKLTVLKQFLRSFACNERESQGRRASILQVLPSSNIDRRGWLKNDWDMILQSQLIEGR